MDVSKKLKKDGVNVSDAVEEGNNIVIFNMINLLHRNGELESRELEGFYYAFEVLRDEFQNIDHSNFEEARKRELKNTFNQSRLDCFMKVYSQVIGYSSAALAFAYMGANASYLFAAPIFLAPMVVHGINYNGYVKGKKYGAENLVKDYLKEQGLSAGFVFHGESYRRMDSYRRKMEAFKGTITNRYDFNYQDSKKVLKHLKLSVVKFGRGLFDLISWSNGSKGISKKLREVEKVFEKYSFTNNVKKDIYEKVSSEIYNEYLSANVENHLRSLVKDRVSIRKEMKEFADKFDDLSYHASKDYKRLKVELNANEREIKKISLIRGYEHANDPLISVYYAGASAMAGKVLDEINRDRDRADTNKDVYGVSKLLIAYDRELALEKRKAYLRIMAPQLMNDIGIDKDNNKHVILFGKCMAVLMDGKKDISETKERIVEIIKDSDISDADKKAELRIRYTDFAEDFINGFDTYKSKSLSLKEMNSKDKKERKVAEVDLSELMDKCISDKFKKKTIEAANKGMYRQRI